MIKTTECRKICLRAETGKVLYNESQNIYVSKAYLFTESEESDWQEVDAVLASHDEEISDNDALAIITGGVL